MIQNQSRELFQLISTMWNFEKATDIQELFSQKIIRATKMVKKKEKEKENTENKHSPWVWLAGNNLKLLLKGLLLHGSFSPFIPFVL